MRIYLLQQLSLYSQDLGQNLIVRGCSQVWPSARKLVPLLLQRALMWACIPTGLSLLPQLPCKHKHGLAVAVVQELQVSFLCSSQQLHGHLSAPLAGLQIHGAITLSHSACVVLCQLLYWHSLSSCGNAYHNVQ